VAIRTFRPRWDRLGLLQDTTVRRAPEAPEDPVEVRAVDQYRALRANQMRTGANGLYVLARIVLVVPVAIIYAVEWVVATVWRGIAALVNRVGNESVTPGS
jgi:hypothetical protein